MRKDTIVDAPVESRGGGEKAEGGACRFGAAYAKNGRSMMQPTTLAPWPNLAVDVAASRKRLDPQSLEWAWGISDLQCTSVEII